MVHRIENGGNYGWSIREGFHPFQPQRRQRPDSAAKIQPPIVEYPHAPTRDRPDTGLSITGGYVYRGKKIPELVGVYVYGDFDSGRIWGLRYENGKLLANGELIDLRRSPKLNIASFGEDAAGRALHPGVRRPDPRAGAAVGRSDQLRGAELTSAAARRAPRAARATGRRGAPARPRSAPFRRVMPWRAEPGIVLAAVAGGGRMAQRRLNVAQAGSERNRSAVP